MINYQIAVTEYEENDQLPDYSDRIIVTGVQEARSLYFGACSLAPVFLYSDASLSVISVWDGGR
jgi:hypothetical protein